MRVTRYPDVGAFYERAAPFLVEREAEHNLILGLSSQLRRNPRMYGEEPYLAVVEEGGSVRGVVFRTPPHNLILSELDDERAIEPIVRAARPEFESLPGVVGPKEPTARFSAAWEAATGATARLTIAQRLLAGGRRFCFLFTDLANPTSNSIYQRIGYRAVRDVDAWTFEAS